jgi:hypothetical protein
MPFGYPLYLWIKNNPVAQGIVAAFVVVALAWVYIKVRIARAIRIDRLKAVIKTQKAVDDYVETVTEETAHEADEALEARDTAQPLHPDGMSDAQYERIFGRRRGPAQSG